MAFHFTNFTLMIKFTKILMKINAIKWQSADKTFPHCLSQFKEELYQKSYKIV